MADQRKRSPQDSGELPVPKPPVVRWTRPIVRFLHIESLSGVVLLVCTVIALGLANSPYAEQFHAIWEMPIEVYIGGFEIMKAEGGHNSLHYWINDCLMVIFFFVVGLEIKREIVAGELSDRKKAMLPVVAALGGMVVPAGIYLAQHFGGEAERGWGVPMATDIAFVVGVMALLGKRVPLGLKIMLLSLAIADDIGAVLVIAIAYTDHLALGWLAVGCAGFVVCYIFNRIGVRAVGIYFIIGAGIWLCFIKSGVHPTVSGVMLGLMTPSSAWIGDKTLLSVLTEATIRVERRGKEHPETPDPTPRTMWQLSDTAREAVSPLERLETSLHPWVSFLIMPLFALANAGVAFKMAELTSPVAIGVATGLLIGKPVGVFLFSFLAVKLGIGALPKGVNWPVILGAGCLAGIGFTMALFVNGLAFAGQTDNLDAGKVGTLSGSLISAILGTVLLLKFLPKKAEEPRTEDVAGDPGFLEGK